MYNRYKFNSTTENLRGCLLLLLAAGYDLSRVNFDPNERNQFVINDWETIATCTDGSVKVYEWWYDDDLSFITFEELFETTIHNLKPKYKLVEN